MTDGDPLHRWLVDDLLALNVILLVAASSLAIALTSRLWHHIHPTQHANNAPSILSAALASWRISPRTAQQQPLVAPPPPEQEHRKSTRSKERRRRGKDPLRDLFKGSKKSKALLKVIKAVDHGQLSPSMDSLRTSSEPGNDTASSTSRPHSPDPARDLLSCDLLSTAMCAESDDGSARDTPSNSITVSSLAATCSGDSDPNSSDTCSQVDDICPHPVSPGPIIPANTAVNVTTAPTLVEHASEDTPSSPPVDADVRTPQARDGQAASASGNCVQLVRARTRLRVAKIESALMPRLISSPLPDSVASPFSSIRSAPSCPALFITPSLHSNDGAGPSTPTHSRGPTPPPRSSIEAPRGWEPKTRPFDQSAVSAQMQAASLHRALEAAHVREERLRAEAEQATKERDEIRWRWNEDASVWRRREAEFQSQIHHLMQQLQAYATVASFQAQQATNLPSSGFSSPTSPHIQHHPLASFPLPPPIQAQNSASPPAHVQALLASAPMLTSHPRRFMAPVAGNLYSGAAPGMSPLSWSGMGLCVPSRDPRYGGRRTPDSSASESSRGRPRQRQGEDIQTASDESSLGDVDGMEDGSGDEDPWEEEEDDIFSNNVLADAILKRPESIRGLGSRARVRLPIHENGVGQPEVGERMDTLKDPEIEDPGMVPPLMDRQ